MLAVDALEGLESSLQFDLLGASDFGELSVPFACFALAGTVRLARYSLQTAVPRWLSWYYDQHSMSCPDCLPAVPILLEAYPGRLRRN